MLDFVVLVALAVAGSLFGPAILCGIAAIYDGYACHRCLLRRALRSAGLVAVAFFVILLGLLATDHGDSPRGFRWDWPDLLVATTMAFAVSWLPGVAAYAAVFHLSRRLHAGAEPARSPGATPPPIRETGNPYQPPAG